MSEIEKIFSCTRCGFCCQGETTVSLNKNDQKRMVDALALDEKVVRAKYWKIAGERIQMKTVDGHCIFYRDGCSVHEGRPWRCGQWPLIPALLTDKTNYLTVRESCPGINKEISYETFCQILSQYLDEHDVVKC